MSVPDLKPLREAQISENQISENQMSENLTSLPEAN